MLKPSESKFEEQLEMCLEEGETFRGGYVSTLIEKDGEYRVMMSPLFGSDYAAVYAVSDHIREMAIRKGGIDVDD